MSISVVHIVIVTSLLVSKLARISLVSSNCTVVVQADASDNQHTLYFS